MKWLLGKEEYLLWSLIFGVQVLLLLLSTTLKLDWLKWNEMAKAYFASVSCWVMQLISMPSLDIEPYFICWSLDADEMDRVYFVTVMINPRGLRLQTNKLILCIQLCLIGFRNFSRLATISCNYDNLGGGITGFNSITTVWLTSKISRVFFSEMSWALFCSAFNPIICF